MSTKNRQPNVHDAQEPLWVHTPDPEALDPSNAPVREIPLSALQLVARDQDEGRSPYGPPPDESDLERQDPNALSEKISRQRAKIDKGSYPPPTNGHAEAIAELKDKAEKAQIAAKGLKAARKVRSKQPRTTKKHTRRPRTNAEWRAKDVGQARIEARKQLEASQSDEDQEDL